VLLYILDIIVFVTAILHSRTFWLCSVRRRQGSYRAQLT